MCAQCQAFCLVMGRGGALKGLGEEDDRGCRAESSVSGLSLKLATAKENISQSSRGVSDMASY